MGNTPELLEILDWVFTVAALVALVVQLSVRDASSYRLWNVVFWVFLAAAFVVDGFESQSWWRWLWFAAAVLALAAIAYTPKSPRYQRLSRDQES